MYSIQQIADKMQAAIVIYKQLINWNDNNKNNKPEYYKGYNTACDMAKKISIHAELEDFPDDLMQSKAPNQTDEQRVYQKQNFRHITGAPWAQMESELDRIWHALGYNIKWTDEHIRNEQKAYFIDKYPDEGSILKYFQQIVSRRKARDPNAVLAICIDIPTVQDPETGEQMTADNQELNPEAEIYHCETVWSYEKGDHALLLDDEMSIVNNGTKDVQEGLILYFYDEATIWQIVQIGKKQDYIFQYNLVLQHNMGTMPAWRIEGIPVTDKDDNIYYNSIYYRAVPYLDTALCDNSVLEVSKSCHAFPFRWEYYEPCEHQGCENGYITSWVNEKETFNKCPICNGLGTRGARSPMSTLQIKIPASGMDANNAIPTPPGGYITPDIESLKFLDDSIDKNIGKALSYAGITTANIKSAPETATGRMIDRDALMVNIKNFSDGIFSLLDNTINAIGYIKWNTNPNKTTLWEAPAIDPPVNFDLRDEDDILDELKTANDANLPAIGTKRLNYQYMSTRFANDTQLQTRYNLMLKVDGLSQFGEDTIMSGRGTLYPEWQCTLHVNIEGYIDDFVEENANWLSLTFAEQKKALIEKAKADTPTKPSFTTADLMNGLNNPANNPPA